MNITVTQKNVSMEPCDTALRMASNAIIAAQASVNLWQRLDAKRRRHHFVHLPGLAVPVIVASNFIIQQNLVLGPANGVYYDENFRELPVFAWRLTTGPLIRSLSHPLHRLGYQLF